MSRPWNLRRLFACEHDAVVDKSPLATGRSGLRFERLEQRLLLAAPNPLELSTLNGTNGFIFEGVGTYDSAGRSVSSAGDVNGDGFDDLLIGASGASPGSPARMYAGETYVVFGGAANLRVLDAADGTVDGRIELSRIDGSNGFVIEGMNNRGYSGQRVSGLGDVNGDGFDDLVVGTRSASPGSPTRNYAGETYVVFGGAPNLQSLDAADGAANGRIEVSRLNGTTGFILEGIDAYDNAGYSLSSAGDVNGDGFADILVSSTASDPGSPTRQNAGETYVIFGGPTNLQALDAADGSADGLIELARLDGSNGFILEGFDALDRSGDFVSSAGDVNGDGFDDLLIGAYRADPGSPVIDQAGETNLVFGGQANLQALDSADGSADGRIELSRLNGTTGFILEGQAELDRSGYAVANAGDVNGDGFDDLLISAYRADPGSPARTLAGEAYIVFGGTTNLQALDSADGSADGRIELSRLNGSNGFRLEGVDAYDRTGDSVSAAGDVNGDGFDDLLIGAGRADPGTPARAYAGETYVVFGGLTNLQAIDLADGTADGAIELSHLNGNNGFVIEGIVGGDESGRSVSGAGDVNGDGFADLLIGASDANPGTPVVNGEGEAYVVFGGNFTPDAGTQVGGTGMQTLSATQGAAVDRLIGGTGDDTLVSDGGSDILLGGEGDDILGIPDADFSGTRRVQGGLGTDTLRLDRSGLHLDLTGIADNRIEEIEVIDITGSGDNSLTVDPQEVLNLSNHSNTLLVRRDNGDVVNIGGGWTQQADETIGPDEFDVFTQGAATIKVQVPPAVSLTLGDQVWIDRNFNGLFDAGVDLTPNGVTVNLYQDNGDGMLDAGDGAPIATTVTSNIGGQDGRYELTGLAAGDYIVEVVTSSGPLTNATSVVGIVDPDNDVDGDDNGEPVVGFEVASLAVTLTAGGETLANQDGDGDTDANLTLDFGFDQPLTIDGNTAIIFGTLGDDFIRAELGSGRVTVNNNTLQLPGHITNVLFDGGPGNDEFHLIGTGGAETVRLFPGVGLLESSLVGVAGQAASMETIVYNGGGGADRVTFVDAPGDDILIGRLDRTLLRGAGYTNVATDVASVTAVANRGGTDIARLFDGFGHETFVANPNAATMIGAASTVSAIGFESTSGMASVGNDKAVLIGSAAADTFVARPTIASRSSGGTTSDASAFDRVVMRGQGGADLGRLFGSTGGDSLRAGPTSSVMTGAGFELILQSVETVIANGLGGNDLAQLSGSAGNDVFSTAPTFAQMTGAGFDLRAFNFERLIGGAGAGTSDLAILTDSTGNDLFFGRGIRGDLLRAGSFEKTIGFDAVRIRGFNGGINRLDVIGITYQLIQAGTWV